MSTPTEDGITAGSPSQLEEDLRREGEIPVNALDLLIKNWNRPIRSSEDMQRQVAEHLAGMIEIRQRFLSLGAGLASLDALARGEHIPILRAIVDDITGVMTRLQRLESHPAVAIPPLNECWPSDASEEALDSMIRKSMRVIDRAEAKADGERDGHLAAITWHLEQLRAAK